MARVKHIVGWISVVLLVVTLASIWMLTEQNVEQTSSLSESTARAVEGQSVRHYDPIQGHGNDRSPRS